MRLFGKLIEINLLVVTTNMCGLHKLHQILSTQMINDELLVG